MYKSFRLKVTVCVHKAFQPKEPTVSGDQGSLFSVVSDVRVTVQVAHFYIKTKTGVVVVHLAKFRWFYCTETGESHMICLAGYAELRCEVKQRCKT